MSVVSVNLIASCESSIGDKNQSYYTLVYRVITNSRTDGALLARTATPWSRGMHYQTATEFDTGSFCTEIRTNQEADDGKQWLTTVQFGPSPNIEESPLNQPWEISLDGQNIEVPYNIDSDGRPVLNTVGDPFATQTMKQMNQPILTITRNEASFNAALTFFANTVNADVFYGGAPGTVFCNTPKQKRDFSSNFGFFYPTTYSFVYDPNGWDQTLLNQGMRSRNARGVYKNVTVQGLPITEPILLGPTGDILPQGVPPISLTYRPYPRMPFAVLGLE